LGKGDGDQRKHFGFVDFFPIEEIAAEHVGLDIITMQEFLESQAMTGHQYTTLDARQLLTSLSSIGRSQGCAGLAKYSSENYRSPSGH
jgi:hypothetical protein